MFYQIKSTSIKIWISFLFPQMVKIIQIGSHIAIIFTTFSSTQQVLKVIIIIIFIGKQGEIVCWQKDKAFYFLSSFLL